MDVLVPEQRLDNANIDALFEQMGGEAVAERVRREALVDIGRCLCCPRKPGFNGTAIYVPTESSTRSNRRGT